MNLPFESPGIVVVVGRTMFSVVDVEVVVMVVVVVLEDVVDVVVGLVVVVDVVDDVVVVVGRLASTYILFTAML